MEKQRYTTEEIIHKRPEADVLIGYGQDAIGDGSANSTACKRSHGRCKRQMSSADIPKTRVKTEFSPSHRLVTSVSA
jgi:hypothetical protein